MTEFVHILYHMWCWFYVRYHMIIMWLLFRLLWSTVVLVCVRYHMLIMWLLFFRLLWSSVVLVCVRYHMLIMWLLFFRLLWSTVVLVCVRYHMLIMWLFIFQIVMEYCGAGSVSDIMRLRNKTVSKLISIWIGPLLIKMFRCSVYWQK